MSRRILVCDDNRDLAQNLQEILEMEGFEADSVGDGEAALRALRDGSFDLLITDVRMPGMNGIELLGAVRGEWPGLPILLITAFARDALLDEGRAAGALGVIPKPLDVGDLLAFIQRIAEAHCPVLLVEDDPALRADLVQVLQDIEGVVPHSAGSVDEALRVARTVKVKAAIIDVRLPDGDGVQLGQALRSRTGPDLALVFISDLGDDARRRIEGELETPICSFLAKPFPTRDLLAAIRQVLGDL